MRLKIVLPVLTAACLTILALLVFSPRPGGGADRQAPVAGPSGVQASSAGPSPAESALQPALAPQPAGPAPATPAPAREPNDAAEAQHQAAVEARVAELGDLGMQDDANAFDRIVGALSDPEPEVRKAAVEATIQFGSQEAIPKLQAAAAQTKDPQEKRAIAQAIEMLKLPSASEIIAEQRARSKQPAQPKPAPGQD